MLIREGTFVGRAGLVKDKQVHVKVNFCTQAEYANKLLAYHVNPEGLLPIANMLITSPAVESSV